MAAYWLSIAAPIVLGLLLSNPIQGKKCDPCTATNTSRVFLVRYKGPLEARNGRENMATSLGDCLTPEAHVDNLIKHFQTRYGINIERLRENAFSNYEDDDYELVLHLPSVGNPDIIISGTKECYAEYTNAPLDWTYWILTTKKDMAANGTPMPAGTWFEYGMFRLSDGGRLACIESRNRHSYGNVPEKGTEFIVDTLLKSPQLGTGESRGMAFFEENIFYTYYSLTFN